MAIVIDGTLKYAIGQGQPGRQAVGADSTFALGSLSKVVLAATIMSLVQDHILDLDRPLGEYLPDLRREPGAALSALTLQQLLTHNAGLPRDLDCNTAPDLDAATHRVASQPLWAPPGSVYSYSNLGYTLLGAVIEAMTQRPFEASVSERGLAPLAMTSAGYGEAAASAQARVHGINAAGDRSGTGADLCPAAWPPGGLVASVRDVGRLLEMLLGGDDAVLTHASLDIMQAGHVATGDEVGAEYAFGLERRSYKGLTLLTHGGLLPHFGAYIALAPARRFGVAVLLNTSGIPRKPALNALDLFLELPSGPAAPVGEPTAYARHVGCYRDEVAGLRTLRVSLSGKGLILTWVGDRPPLLPVTGTFFPANSPERSEFLATSIGIARRIPDSVCTP
jgi:CubicO group peptidase (beta-lactamase class C family)